MPVKTTGRDNLIKGLDGRWSGKLTTTVSFSGERHQYVFEHEVSAETMDGLDAFALKETMKSIAKLNSLVKGELDKI